MKICKKCARRQFDVIFTPQREGGFTAEVPDLPGCISEGDSLEEAQLNIQEAIQLYLETLQDRGIPLPDRSPEKTFHIQMVVTLSPKNAIHA